MNRHSIFYATLVLKNYHYHMYPVINIAPLRHQIINIVFGWSYMPYNGINYCSLKLHEKFIWKVCGWFILSEMSITALCTVLKMTVSGDSGRDEAIE
jgi:hypothetical protein